MAKRDQGKRYRLYGSVLRASISIVERIWVYTETHCGFIIPFLASTDKPILPCIFDVKSHGVMLPGAGFRPTPMERAANR